LIQLSFGPDAAAVTSDDTLDGGQADAGAFELVLAVQAVENPKQIAGVLRR
jgi:hypothetical protein